MDFNLTKWLKDDLGLKHMSETDMNNLVYHPRHGSLCRRLVKFLTESTICSKRYPNVFAKEEHETARNEYEYKEKLIRELLSKLETQMRSSENTQSRLKFMREKYQCLVKMEDMLRCTTEALEEMASRPNISLIEVGRNLENPKYLGNLSLETLYSTFPSYLQTSSSASASSSLSASSFKLSDKITRRDLANANDEYHTLSNKAQVMHSAIGELLVSILEATNVTDCDVKLNKTSVASLKALRMPECEEIVYECDPEERQLREQRTRLMNELRETDQQVTELEQQYNDQKAELNRRFKEELEKDLMLLKTLQQMETTICTT